MLPILIKTTIIFIVFRANQGHTLPSSLFGMSTAIRENSSKHSMTWATKFYGIFYNFKVSEVHKFFEGSPLADKGTFLNLELLFYQHVSCCWSLLIPPENIRKSCFLMFSEGIERDHIHQIYSKSTASDKALNSV